MADFKRCLDWVLLHEGGWSDHPADSGGPTMYGITLQVANEYGIKGVKELHEISPEKVQEIYRDGYWRFDGVRSDEVAAKVLDMAVNMGLRRAIRLLQQAVNGSRVEKVDVDGAWGPRTLEAVNRCNPDWLLEQLKAESLAHYDAIVEARPDQMVFMKGWERRARALPWEAW